MIRLEPSLFKGYTFPDVTMWPKVWPPLAITFQEWLAGKYGDDVSAAMAVLQQRIDADYRRMAGIRAGLEQRNQKAR